MLTYLDSLCDAMTTRDVARLHNLVDDHPLARLLPADAMAEVRRFLTQKVSRHTVPLVTLRFRDQTARLLNELPPGGVPAPSLASMQAPPDTARRRRASLQTELPLSA